MHEVKFSATFYGDDQTILALSHGLSSLTGDQDGPSEFNTYTVLLLHQADTDRSSWLFPTLRVIHDTTLNYAKTAATEISLQFLWSDRNRYNSLYYLDTADNLAAILGSRSPI